VQKQTWVRWENEQPFGGWQVIQEYSHQKILKSDYIFLVRIENVGNVFFWTQSSIVQRLGALECRIGALCTAQFAQPIATPLIVQTYMYVSLSPSSITWYRCRGNFVTPGKFFPPSHCHNVTNANPKFNHIFNINPNSYCCAWE